MFSATLEFWGKIEMLLKNTASAPMSNKHNKSQITLHKIHFLTVFFKTPFVFEQECRLYPGRHINKITMLECVAHDIFRDNNLAIAVWKYF